MVCIASALVAVVFTLEECISCGLHSNPEIVSSYIEAAQSQVRLRCSRLEYLPSLNLYLNQYFNWGRSVDMQELVIIRNQLTKQSGASVGTSLTIYDGMRRINGTAREKELLKSAQWSVKAAEMEIAGEITRAYLECLLAKELQASLERIHAGTISKAAAVEALCRSGATVGSSLTEIHAQQALEEASIVQAANEVHIARERLAILMGYDNGTESFDIEEIDAEEVLKDACPELHLAAPQSPKIQALDHKIKAAEYGVRVARGLLQPSICLTGAYGTYYSDRSPDNFSSQLHDNVNPSLTISVSLPVFSGGAAISEVSSAEASLENAKNSRSRALIEMESLLNSAERECIALKKKAEADCAFRQACIEKEQAAADKLLEGASGTTEYINAIKETFQSEKEYLCSLYRYLFQQKIIEHYNSYGR